MKASAPPAKITRPSSSGIFPRQRLFRLLDPGQREPILWVTGPPGTGKTTLVASWLDARQIRSLWYQVDDGDTDPASFFYYLGLAAKRFAPRKRKPLPLLTPEYLQGIPTFSRRYFEELYTRMLSAANNPHPVIVFDNYQQIAEGSLFHTILYEGLSAVPDGIKIIMISRKGPPDAFVRFRANRLMKAIGWSELKFTLDESTRLVRLRGHKAVSPEAIKQLHEKTDGWAAGIILLLEGARDNHIESVLSKAHTSKELFQYFAMEIFERAEPSVRDFLLKTSLFPGMSAGMTEALTGNHEAGRILADLNGRNFFTQRLDAETHHYQYHPLFREFLLGLAREIFDDADLTNLEKKLRLSSKRTEGLKTPSSLSKKRRPGRMPSN